MHANKLHDSSSSIVTSDAIPMINFNANCAQLRSQRINQHLDIEEEERGTIDLSMIAPVAHYQALCSASGPRQRSDLPMASKRKLVDKIRNKYDSG